MKDPKCEFGAHARTRKYKIVFAKVHTLNWSEEVFAIKKIKKKNTVPWTNTISNLKEGIVGPFYKKEYQKTNQAGFRVEKVIKRKCDKVL